LQGKVSFYPRDSLGYLLYPFYIIGIANYYKMTQARTASCLYLVFEQRLSKEIKEELIFSNGEHPFAAAATEKYSFHLLASTRL
jgi:hypothetical protein